MIKMVLGLGAGAILLGGGIARADDTRDAIAMPLGTVVFEAHAVGAQIYECKPDAGGKLVWRFREPIAALLRDGKTIGRHFAGPSWETADGSRVVGKVTAKAPGASSADIPWLTLDVTQHQGAGLLDGVTTVRRINTTGGNKAGPCALADTLVAEPYAADYIFSHP